MNRKYDAMQIIGKTQKVNKKSLTKSLQTARNGFECLNALNVRNGRSQLSKCGNPEVRHYSYTSEKTNIYYT